MLSTRRSKTINKPSVLVGSMQTGHCVSCMTEGGVKTPEELSTLLRPFDVLVLSTVSVDKYAFRIIMCVEGDGGVSSWGSHSIHHRMQQFCCEDMFTGRLFSGVAC